MRCREGCENERKTTQIVCRECWARVPLSLRLECGFIGSLVQMTEAEKAIRDWLVAADSACAAVSQRGVVAVGVRRESVPAVPRVPVREGQVCDEVDD